MSWIDWKTRKQLRIEAENVAWAKYEKSLTELNERMGRRITQQAEDMISAVKAAHEAMVQAVNQSTALTESAFKEQEKQLSASYEDKLSWYKSELEKSKETHTLQIKAKDEEMTSKFDELNRTQARLDKAKKAYESGCEEVMKVSQKLGELTARIDQKSYNDKMEASETQAAVKDVAHSNEHLSSVVLQNVHKTVMKGAANKDPL